MSYLNKQYLITQFQNFADRIADVFAKKGEIPKVIDDLESESKTDALSANQGRVLGQHRIRYTYDKDTQKLSINGGFTGRTESNYYDYDNYSAEEQVIGRWIDGKPIYETVWIGTTEIQPNTDASVDIGVSNVDAVIDLFGVVYNSNNGNRRPLPFVHRNNNYSVGMFFESGKLQLRGGTDCVPSTKINVVMQYTKTSDAEDSFSVDMITNDVVINDPTEEDVDDILSLLGG